VREAACYATSKTSGAFKSINDYFDFIAEHCPAKIRHLSWCELQRNNNTLARDEDVNKTFYLVVLGQK